MSISKIKAIIEIIIRNIFLIILFSLEIELLSVDTNSFDVLSFVEDFFEFEHESALLYYKILPLIL